MLHSPPIRSFWPSLVAQLPPINEERHVVLYDLRHFRLSIGESDASRALQTFARTARHVSRDPLIELPVPVREVLLGTRIVFVEHPATQVTTAVRLDGARVVELGDEFASLGAIGLRLKRLLKRLQAQSRGFARAAGVAAGLTAVVWGLAPSGVMIGAAGLLEFARYALLLITVALFGAALESYLGLAKHRAELEALERRVERACTQC